VASAWLRKTKGVPGSAGAGLVWNTPDDVVEVDYDLAQELKAIPDAGFVDAAAPGSTGDAMAQVDAGVLDEHGAQKTEISEAPAAAPKKRAASRGKATTAASGPQDAPPSADVVEFDGDEKP
jgi:hypothetical protein